VDNREVRVKIDQLLFGYRDGHELLASSVKIDARLEAQLLPHADASFEDRSDHYLVGVPVQPLERFMLTRIWPAPELPRPGAVWAHSLLIDETALGFVDPLQLLELFHRPSKPNELDRYTSAFDFETTEAKRASGVPDPLMIALCDVAYRGTAAVVIWPEESDAEFGLMALWRRLPMHERHALSFRSRGRARTGASAYLIQLATQLGGRSATQQVRIVVPSEVEPTRPILLLAEASQDPAHPLGRVLDEFALDVTDSLAIAELWPLVSEPDPPALLDELATMKSDALASKLASALFGPADSTTSWWDLGEDRRIIALLQSEVPLAQALLNMPRLRAAWDRDRETVLALLDQRKGLPGDSAKLLVESALDVMAIDELLARAEDRELIASAIDTRAELLSQPQLWAALEESSDAELRDLALGKADTHAVPLLVGTESWDLLDQALSDPEMLRAGLDLVAERSPTDPALWDRVLSSRGPGLVRLLSSKKELPPAAVILAAAELHQALLDQVPTRRWTAAAPLIHDRGDDVALTAAARLIAWTLRRKKPSRELLIECFGPAHRAIETRHLSARAKGELDRSLPQPKVKSLSKRLNRVLIENMESVDWSQSELRRALEPAGPEAQRMIKHVPKKHPARRLVEGTLRDLEEMLPFP
jgi:hypothetical protein